MGRRHPYVGDDQVRALRLHQCEQFLAVCSPACDLKAHAFEELHQSFPKQHRVLGDDYAAILENPALHAGQVYPLFGRKEMNHFEIAEENSKVLGKPVT